MVQKSKKVGILDADIFDSSIPRLLSLTGRPRTNAGNIQALQLLTYTRKSINTAYELWLEGNVDGLLDSS